MAISEKPRGGAPMRINLMGETYWYHCQFETNGSSTPDGVDPSGAITVARTGTGVFTVTFDERIKPAAIHQAIVNVEENQAATYARFISYAASTGIATIRQYTASTSVGVAATGTITCVAKANFDDNDTVTIGDGFTPPKIYEFDFAGDGVTAGSVQVNISGATDAASCAAILKTAIEANQPLITVVDAGAGVLNLTHDIVGTAGNITITEDVTDAGFLVTGMSGGSAGASALPVAADSTDYTIKCSFLCARKAFAV